MLALTGDVPGQLVGVPGLLRQLAAATRAVLAASAPLLPPHGQAHYFGAAPPCAAAPRSRQPAVLPRDAAPLRVSGSPPVSSPQL